MSLPPDSLTPTIFALVLYGVGVLCCALVARRFLKEAPLLWIPCGFLIWYLTVSTVAVGLSLLSSLSGGLLIALTLVLSLGGALLSIRGGRKFHFQFFQSDSTDYVFLLLGLLTVTALSSWWSFFNLYYPSFAWDTWNYHRPISLFALQEQSIFNPPTGIWAIHSYPKNSELNASWLIGLSGWIHTARVFPVFVYIAATLSVAQILKDWKLPTGVSLLLASTASASPAVIAAIGRDTGDVDLHLGFQILLTIALLNHYFSSEEKYHSYLLFASIAIFTLSGLKGTGLLYSLILAVVMILVIFASKERFKILGTVIAVGSIAFLLTSSYWIIHNLNREGNPLGAIQVEAFGVTLFEGERTIDDIVPPNEKIRDRPPWRAYRRSVKQTDAMQYFWGDHLGGWGILYRHVVFYLWFLSLAWFAYIKHWNAAAVHALLFLMLLLTPAYWWSRFGIFHLLALPLPFAALFHIPKIHQGLIRGVCVTWWFIVALLTSVWSYQTHYVRFPHVIEQLLPLRNRNYTIHQDSYDPLQKDDPMRLAYLWLGENLPEGSTILYDVVNEPNFAYLFWRPDAKNRVIHKSLNSKEDIDEIEELDYIALLSGHRESGALEASEDWSIVFENEAMKVYGRFDSNR